jgi:hypothetical protein
MNKGKCRLCGQFRELSFEHVPPEKAFNDVGMLRVPGNALLGQDPAELRGKAILESRGHGAHTLCILCNRTVGRYAPTFVNCAREWQRVLSQNPSLHQIQHTVRIRPLTFFKQIAAMFVSTVEPGITDRLPQLRKYLLDSSCRDQPQELRYFMALTKCENARQSGFVGRAELGAGTVATYAELAFRPFIFLVTAGNSDGIDPRFFEISDLGKEARNVQRDVALTLHVLDLAGYIPGMYRRAN